MARVISLRGVFGRSSNYFVGGMDYGLDGIPATEYGGEVPEENEEFEDPDVRVSLKEAKVKPQSALSGGKRG